MPKLAKDRLTREILSSLAHGQELADAGQPGLTARRLASGSIVFCFRYRANGAQKRVTLGTYSDAYPVEAARKAARALLAEVDQGADPRAEATAVKSAPTFADAAALYVSGHVVKHCKPGSARGIETLLRLHILPRLGDRKLDEVKRADIERMHSEIAAAGKPTANQALVVIKAVFNYADKVEIFAARNPAKGVRKYAEVKRERYLSPDERARLWTGLEAALERKGFQKGRFSPGAVHAIRLLIMTGGRRSEILDLEWSMVSWEHSAIFLDRDHSKVGGHTIPLSSIALDYLRGLYEARDSLCPFVCPSLAGTAIHPSNLQRAWASIREIAGLADVHLHDLRHALASDAINAGVPLEIIKEMLGHKSIRTTQRYAHLSRATIADAVERTAKIIAERSAGSPSNVINIQKRKPA